MSAVPAELLALQRLYHWERSAPERISLTQPMGSGRVQDFTWAQVADGARRMAAHLQSLNLAPGSRIAILSKNCAWWLMSDLAIWMAGHVVVPLYPTLVADTIAQILEHSEARLLFVGKLDGWEDMKPGVPADLPCISYPLSPAEARQAFEGWDEICARSIALPGEPVRAADELCTLVYTSGTTGLAKGVMHSFGSFAAAALAALERFPMREDDRSISYLPLAHVVERMLIEHAWLHASTHMFFAESIDSFNADLQRAKPTVFFSVPLLWGKFQHGVHAKLPPAKLNLLLKLPLIAGLIRRKVLTALGLDQCRLAGGGAAPMPPALLDWYAGLGLPIVEGYGMTECPFIATTLPGHRQHGTVGLPLAGCELRIDAASGEVQARSSYLMLGYYKEPQLSAEAFTADGWLHTGDKGEIGADGCLRITGRLKDPFKTSKGKYVSPGPIESRLTMHPAIETCMVSGAGRGQPLGLALLTAEAIERCAGEAGRSALLAQLGQHLAQVNARLDPHERLAGLVALRSPWTIANGLLTPTMKLRRDRIDAAYAGHYDAWMARGEPVLLGD